MTSTATSSRAARTDADELDVRHEAALVGDPHLRAGGRHSPELVGPPPAVEQTDDHGHDALVRVRRHFDLHEISVDQLAAVVLGEVHEVLPREWADSVVLDDADHGRRSIRPGVSRDRRER